MTVFTLRNPAISLQARTLGAEIISLKSTEGLEQIWQAGPEWPGHTPLMFPVIGRTLDNTIRHKGREYPMPQHGFARDHEFEVVESSDSTLTLRLQDNAQTRQMYPFSFQLTTSYRLEGRAVCVRHDVSNTGETDMPGSLGWHPAFAWPGDRDGSAVLEFECEEGPTIGRLDPTKVLLLQESAATPVHGKALTLVEDTFSSGALCFLDLNSRSVAFKRESGPKLTVSFPEFQHLTVWKAANAGMLCLEPWYGTPSPEGFRGELADKPYQSHLSPAAQRSFSYSVALN